MLKTDQEETFLHKTLEIKPLQHKLSGNSFTLSNSNTIITHLYILTIPPFNHKIGLILPNEIECPFDFFCYSSTSTGTQRCKLEYLQSMELDIKSFELLYQFHKFLYCDLSLTSIKLIDSKTINFEDLFNCPSDYFNLLIHPVNSELQIDITVIENLLNIRFSPEVEKIDIFKPEMIVQSRHNSRVILSVIAVVHNVNNFTLADFFEIIFKELIEKEKYSNSQIKKSTSDIFKEILNFYSIEDFEKVKNLSFVDFICDLKFDANIHHVVPTTFIGTFRIKADKGMPLLLLNDIYGLMSFEHTNKNKVFTDSCAKHLSSPLPRLYFADDLDVYALQSPLINDFMRMPSILEMMFKFYPIKVFKTYYDLNINDDVLLIKSFCTKKFDFEFNLESLETLGDVILKVIQIFHIFVSFDDINEGQITKLKGLLISNVHYSEIANNLGLQFFISNDIDFKPNFPIFQKPSKKIIQNITRKNMGDCFEALIGTMFLEQNTFTNIFSFLIERTNIFFDKYGSEKTMCNKCQNNIKNQEKSVFCLDCFACFSNSEIKNLSKTGLENNLFTGDFENESNYPILYHRNYPNASRFLDYISNSPEKMFLYRSLIETPHYHFSFDKIFPTLRKIKSIEDLGKYNNGQFTKLTDLKTTKKNGIKKIQNILNYKFKNLDYLKTAMNTENKGTFQRFEVFGDVFCELLAIGTLMPYFRKNNIETSPEKLQIAKLCLLSNLSMAKIMIAYGMDDCLKFEDDNLFNQVVDLKKIISEKTDLEELIDKKIDYDFKQLSDCWEALCFAVFFDGGWQALSDSFLRLYAPFIFIVIQKINVPLIDKDYLNRKAPEKDLVN